MIFGNQYWGGGNEAKSVRILNGYLEQGQSFMDFSDLYLRANLAKNSTYEQFN